MVQKIVRSRFKVATVASVVTGALVLGACGAGNGAGKGRGEGSMADSAGGVSVPAGSEASAYVDALKDADPITINFGGMTTGPGSPTTDAYVEYGEMVSEMSGGKITFKYDYAGAKVSVDKMSDALEQGRMDMGLYAPTLQPENWPVVEQFTGISSVEHPDPIAGRLSTFAARAELSQSWDALRGEADGRGITPLYPINATSGAIRLTCKDDVAPTSLKALKGHLVRVSSPSHAGLAKALGMVPVDLPNGELFTGLQRGVIECALNGVSTIKDQGLDDVTNSFVTGTEAGHEFVESPISFGLSARKWAELPLAAQQLLWDTQPKFLELQIKNAGLVGVAETVEVMKEGGFDINHYGGDVTDVMDDYYEKERSAAAKTIEEKGMADDGQAVADEYAALVDKWYEIATDELGYSSDPDWSKLTADDVEKLDVMPFVEKFYQEVLLPIRPE